MNRRLLFPLLMCGLLLAGCYRQAEDPFEQVDSQSVESIASPTVDLVTETPVDSESGAQSVTGTVTSESGQPSKTPDPDDLDPTDIVPVTPTLSIPATGSSPLVPTATSPVFLTPEPPPGQVVQPTVNPPTATATFDIVPPSPTNVADGPQAGDECIHEVVAGDTLFRIAINNGTTVEAIQQLNSLESDAIQIGQLIRIPGCVADQADADVTSAPTTLRPTVTSQAGGSSVATVQPVDNVPTTGQQIHVVVSGETLGAIARRYNTSINAIVELNQLDNPNALSVGQEILIPASG